MSSDRVQRERGRGAAGVRRAAARQKEGSPMWKRIGRWTLGVVSSVMLTVPALSARADHTEQMKDNASEAGQHAKSAGKSAGNAAESSGKAAGHGAEKAWDSSKGAAKSTGNTVEHAGHQGAKKVE